MGPLRLLSIASLLLITLHLVAAARTQQVQQLDAIRIDMTEGDQESNKRLNTYYFDATKPLIELSSRGSSRPERTALTVKLSQGSVTTFMPVVNPKPSGMTHSVSNTWNALKVSSLAPADACRTQQQAHLMQNSRCGGWAQSGQQSFSRHQTALFKSPAYINWH